MATDINTILSAHMVGPTTNQCKDENIPAQFGITYTGAKGFCYPDGSDTIFQMNLFTPNEDGSSKCHGDSSIPSPAEANNVYLNVENYGFDRELKLNFCN